MSGIKDKEQKLLVEKTKLKEQVDVIVNHIFPKQIHRDGVSMVIVDDMKSKEVEDTLEGIPRNTLSRRVRQYYAEVDYLESLGLSASKPVAISRKLKLVINHLFKKEEQRKAVMMVVNDRITSYEAEKRLKLGDCTVSRYVNKYKKEVEYLAKLGIELPPPVLKLRRRGTSES